MFLRSWPTEPAKTVHAKADGFSLGRLARPRPVHLLVPVGTCAASLLRPCAVLFSLGVGLSLFVWFGPCAPTALGRLA